MPAGTAQTKWEKPSWPLELAGQPAGFFAQYGHYRIEMMGDAGSECRRQSVGTGGFIWDE